MTKSFDIRSHLAKNPVLLAPMAGVNDPVFREICKRMGAGLTYSEMVSAQGLAHASQRTQELLSISDAEKPAAVQLFGKDPTVLAAQAQAIVDQYGDRLALIDINMGCPVRKVAGKGEGAALLKDPAAARSILETVVRSTDCPITVKFRKGFERHEDTAVEFAKMAESCGVAAITVHGRSARQLYQGESDRAVIARVKEAVSIPVIASGDVWTPADVHDYLQVQKANGVMVARGAQGNPWIFARALALLNGNTTFADTPVTLAERITVASEHLHKLALRFPLRLPTMKKHLSWYFKGMTHASAIRRAAHSCSSVTDFEQLLDNITRWEIDDL
ncbi:MAG: tRNA dihydrouridine synthase DusB [Coriobacteriaceae bacterium]|nr:tRNA dihydrouridine synthase DusB [Coriobacteriaceae bacterium]